MTTDIDKLAQQMREAAGLATPGPWRRQTIEDEGDDCGRAYIVGANLEGLVGAALPWPTELETGDFTRVEANAKFMEATNPTAVLALLDDRERLVTALAAKERECEGLQAALAHEESYLLRLLADDNLMRGDIDGTFHRLRTGDIADAFATSGGGNG